MAADITLLFKASVKTVKTRNKALGLIESNSRDETSAKRPRPRPKERDSFSSRAREVVSPRVRRVCVCFCLYYIVCPHKYSKNLKISYIVGSSQRSP